MRCFSTAAAPCVNRSRHRHSPLFTAEAYSACINKIATQRFHQIIMLRTRCNHCRAHHSQHQGQFFQSTEGRLRPEALQSYCRQDRLQPAHASCCALFGLFMQYLQGTTQSKQASLTTAIEHSDSLSLPPKRSLAVIQDKLQRLQGCSNTNSPLHKLLEVNGAVLQKKTQRGSTGCAMVRAGDEGAPEGGCIRHSLAKPTSCRPSGPTGIVQGAALCSPPLPVRAL